MTSAAERREELKRVYERARSCTRCPLHQTRTTVVFGSGNADAELMFVGEAPGANEDRQGLPFVGQAGKLLSTLLGEIGMTREDVFVANTVKCRPPGNRDPHPNELEACSEYLYSQVRLLEPTMICTLGNFATKLLRGDPTGISRLHGQPEVRTVGSRAIRLYPLYHPAAALYTPSTLEVLRADFRRIPELLALGPPPQPELAELAEPVPEPEDGGSGHHSERDSVATQPNFAQSREGPEARTDGHAANEPAAPPDEPAAPSDDEPAAPLGPAQLGLF